MIWVSVGCVVGSVLCVVYVRRLTLKARAYCDDTARLATERADLACQRADALQGVINRAWDAAHEFEGEFALRAACEWLEPAITPSFAGSDASD